MANNIIDATLRFVDKFSSPFKSAISNASQNVKKLQQTANSIKKIGTNVTNIGKTATKMVTVPIAAAATACVKLAADFEQSMDKVQSISGASSDDMKKLSEKAKEMGAKTKFSASEAADAFSYMAMAGWKTNDMMDGIEGVMYLAGASGEDLASTSDIVTDALTAFGMTAKDTNEFVDILAAASNNANTNVSMLGESFKYCAPIAGAMKYSAQDVATSLGLMANSGIKASQAGTSMRSLLTNLAKPTDTVQGAMDRLGISLTDSKGNMLPLVDVVENLRDKFSELTEAEKTKEAAALAGKTGMSGLLAIVNASEKDYTKLAGAIDNSSGAAKKMYNVANSNFNGQLTILKSTLESIGISFGNILLPYFKQAASKVQILSNKFNSFSTEQKKTIVLVTSLAAAAGPMLLITGKVIMMTAGVIKFTAGVGRMVKMVRDGAGILKIMAVSGNIMAVGIVAGVALIIAAVLLVVTHWKQIKAFCIPIIKKLGSAAKATGKAIASAFNAVKKKIAEFVSKTGIDTGKISKQFSKMKNNIKTIVNNMKTIFGTISKALKSAINKLKPVWTLAVAIIKDGISKIKGPFSSIGKFLLNAFMFKFRTAVKMVIGFLTGFVSGLTTITSGIIKSLKGVTDFIVGVFTGNWTKAFNGLRDIAGGAFESLVGIVKTPINAIVGMVNSLISSINGISVDIPDWVPGVGGKHVGFSISSLPALYKGTNNWRGGITSVNERGGEIIDLPSHSRVIPHDKSIAIAYGQGKQDGSRKGNTTNQFVFQVGTLKAGSEEEAEAFCKMIMDKLDNWQPA